jgi:hypothetical protein
MATSSSTTTSILMGLLALLLACGLYQVSFSTGERSVVLQVVKYFARPHDTTSAGIPTGPVTSGAYWFGRNLSTQQHRWIFELNAKEVDIIRSGVRFAMGLNKSLNRYVAADLPLQSLDYNMTKWRNTLDSRNPDALGLVIIRGIPVREWSIKESEVFWWCFGLHLGIPGAQNSKGDLIGNIKDEFHSYDKTTTTKAPIGEIRQYRTNEAIGFHCDVADVVGLLCLQSSGVNGGGRSRLVSSVTVFNVLQQRRPDLVPALFERWPMDTRGDGGVDWFYLTPASFYNNTLRTFWHTEYFLSAYRHKSAPPGPSARLQELVEVYDGIANDPALYMETEFKEGDIQLISNHLVTSTFVSPCLP